MYAILMTRVRGEPHMQIFTHPVVVSQLRNMPKIYRSD